MLKNWNRFNKLLKKIESSSEFDKLFPGKSERRVREFFKKTRDYIQNLDLVSNSGSNFQREWDEIDVDLEEVLPKPINKLFRQSYFQKVDRLISDMEVYCRDKDSSTVYTSFLGVILAYYVMTMKNLYFIGTAPYFYKDLSIDFVEDYDYTHIGVSEKEYKKLIPILSYIDMKVDELLDVDVSKSDINYFHIILKRLIESEVDV